MRVFFLDRNFSEYREFCTDWNRELPLISVRGFDLEWSHPFRGAAVRHAVSWKDKTDLAELTGRQIRLRFANRDGHLYSFRLIP